MWPLVLALTVVVMVFAAMRLDTDVPALLDGTPPPADSFERRYFDHPVLAYAHIGAGVLYLLGALLQLSRGFRERHVRVHRRVGRVVLPAGLLAGAYALAFGLGHSWGGAGEASATVVFGLWFLACLVTAFRAIRSGDVVRHRRWMIRAFSVGLAVASIRLWIGLFQAGGLLSIRDSFAVAFWLAFVLHVLAAELYLKRRPAPDAARPPATV